MEELKYVCSKKKYFRIPGFKFRQGVRFLGIYKCSVLLS
jgi:hypothetical protein